MMDSQEIRKNVQKENELRAAYARLFGGGDLNARIVMEDLEKRGFFNEPTFDEKKPDPYLSTYREGIRSVVLHIKTMTASRPINEEEFIKEALKNEE